MKIPLELRVLVANRPDVLAQQIERAKMSLTYDKFPVTRYGLLCEPVLNGGKHSFTNNQDSAAIPLLHDYIFEHFDSYTVDKFTELFLSVRDKATHVLEIGIDNSNTTSSTHIILSHKKDETIYIGVDIRVCDHIDRNFSNAHTLKASSSAVEAVKLFLEKHGAKGKGIHFIFIDGWHSLNQVLCEWEYIVEYLAPDGVAVFHDTNYHLGPYILFEVLDPDIFVGKKYFEGELNWGLGEVRHKTQEGLS